MSYKVWETEQVLRNQRQHIIRVCTEWVLYCTKPGGNTGNHFLSQQIWDRIFFFQQEEFIMQTAFLMGNEAIAMGALAAGVNVVAGYPGTPSTEVLETIAKKSPSSVYVEWSVNEKAAMELAAGAAYAGARTLVTMKQVGLNVASDPLMSLAYIGVKGGMVVMVADDPGPISSQTEQDTRTFASFAKIPCFDPSSVQEAYEMMQDAFRLSEEQHTPVFFRPTTRICHAYASVSVLEQESWQSNMPEGFVRDPSKWVIFPRLSFQAHAAIEKRNRLLSEQLSTYSGNTILPGSLKKGIASQGISFSYVQEMRDIHPDVRVLKVATPFPFPEELALRFLNGLDEVLCIEELDPVIERALTEICGKYHLQVKIRGKLTNDIPLSGENAKSVVRQSVSRYLGTDDTAAATPLPPLPIRPPVLCAGCPHRASFLAVKQAAKGQKCVFCGDIGCYTLGNAMPLDMVDTCLCMGAGINIAQGISRIEPDTTCFAFVGDSTFFASSITGIVNAVYNQANLIVVILDNSTTAMTGHQPHPGTGKNARGDVATRICIEEVLHGIGVPHIYTCNPLAFDEAKNTVREAMLQNGVRAIIFRSPCVAVVKGNTPFAVDQTKCVSCRKCIREVGCPEITIQDNQVHIGKNCTGCSLCAQICPVGAICRKEV